MKEKRERQKDEMTKRQKEKHGIWPIVWAVGN